MIVLSNTRQKKWDEKCKYHLLQTILNIWLFRKRKNAAQSQHISSFEFHYKNDKNLLVWKYKGNMMGCRILLIAVKSREISSKGRGEVPNGKFLRLLKNKVFTKHFPGRSLRGKTYSTFGTLSTHLVRPGIIIP